MRGLPRRVLMTTDTVGGVYSYALTLAQVLSDQGIDVMLVSMGPRPSADQRAQAEAIAGLTLVETTYQLEWMDDPWREVDAAGEALLALERSFRPDLIHLNGYVHGALPFAAPTLVVAHSCVLSWWQAVKAEPAPARYHTYRERVRRGLLCADMVVAPSHAMLAALRGHYGPLPLTRVLPNGCDLSAYFPREKRAQIVGAGRVWDEAKNLRSLERVARALPWPVMVAGDLQDATGSLSRHASSEAFAQYLGKLPQAQLSELLGASAIFAAPARYEPFGLSILEAAACGCALVLGDIPSLRELWSDCALFVPPDDDDALASALQSLTSDALLRRRVAARAQERAQRFSHGSFGQQYLDLYRALLQRRHALVPSRAVSA